MRYYHSLQRKKDDFDTVVSAVNKLVDFAKPTYGPSNYNILIKRFGEVLAIDDGRIISEEFYSEDKKEQEVIEFIRSANRSTDLKEGDGNVTTMLILQSLVNEYHENKYKFFPKSNKEIIKEWTEAVKEAEEELEYNKTEISSHKDLMNVARIAFNNSSIATLVADIVLKIGKDGMVYTEQGTGMETTYSISPGLEVERGFVSPYMSTVENKEMCELDNPLILITDQDIKNWKDIQTIVANCKEADKPLVIVCNSISDSALEFIVNNKLKKIHTTIAIEAPELGERKSDFFKDLSVVTGGKVIGVGDVKSFTDLGQCEKVICDNDSSKFVGGKGNQEDIDKRVEHLKSRLEDLQGYNKVKVQREIASLVGGVAVIKIGAPTDSEIKSLVPKIQNAVNSAHSAYKHGVIKGAALSLSELNTSSKMFNKAMQYPHRVLLDNCEEKYQKFDYYTAKNYNTGEVGNYLEVGVIDPVNVILTAIRSAVSIAILLINNKGIIDNTNK
jgi:chaperonin GroEL